MQIAEFYLTPQELKDVPALIGQNIWQVYTPQVFVDSITQVMESPSYSLYYNKPEFFGVQTHWMDMGHYDYYRLELGIKKKPLGLKMTRKGAIFNPSTIRLATHSKVILIELFSTEKRLLFSADGSEDIILKYDSALVFHQEDGNSFLLGICETIADLTMLTRDKKAISERIEGLHKRLEWR